MMKRFFLLLASLAFVGTLVAETVENTVELTLKTVQVYPQGALLSATGRVSLKEGNSTIVLRQVGRQINRSSISIALGQGASVTSFEYTPISRPMESALLTERKDSLLRAQKQLQKQEGLLYTNEREVAFLDSGLVYQMRAQQTKPSNDMISSGLEFYHNKADGLHERLIATQNTLTQLKKTIALLKQKINEELRNNAQGFEVLAYVHATHAVTTPLTLSYFTTRASWSMEYQATVERDKSQIDFLAKASITQNTGQDWKDVHLVLSNFQPSFSTEVPTLAPWRLSYSLEDRSSAEISRALAGEVHGVQRVNSENLSAKRGAPRLYEAEDEVKFVQNDKALHVEFTIDRAYTIATGGQVQKIDLKNYAIESAFSYICVPRLETKVYLMATLKNWEQYHLLSGTVNLNLDGQFVGRTYLDVSGTDSLTLSIGEDKRIVVERTLEDKLSSKRIIGNNKRVVLVYLNKFKNTSGHDIDLMVMEQVPVSTDKSIRVEWMDLSSKPDEYVEKEGKLIYKLSLPKNQTIPVKVGYEITSDKTKTLNL